MAISVDWATKVITIPKADTTLVSIGPPEIRALDTDVFRLALKALEASEEGMPFLDTHSHNKAVTVGGVTLAQVIIIINGYTVTFENGAYAVNLVGSNNNIGDVVNLNSVSIRSSNSAGLTFSQEILNQSFQDGLVALQPASMFSGTSFPTGTLGNPVNNWADAEAIRAGAGLKGFWLDGVLALGAGEDIENHRWSSANPLVDSLSFAGGGNANSTFVSIALSGSLSGPIRADDCIVVDGLTGFEGALVHCGLDGVLSIDPAATSRIVLFDCISIIAGTAKPELDCSGAAADFSIRNYTGGLLVSNFSGGGDMTLDVLSASIELAPTCTAGTIVIRGLCHVVDNSGPGCTVIRNAATYIEQSLAQAYGEFAFTEVSPGITDVTYKDLSALDLFTLRLTDGVGRTRTSG